METLKRKWRNLPLRRFFVLTVCICLGVVVILSALVIWGLTSFRRFLLPEPDEVYLTVEMTMEDGSVVSGEYLLGYGADLEEFPWLLTEEGPAEQTVRSARYSVKKVEKSIDRLSPKRKFAYRACGILMVGAPALFSFAGILLCSLYFFRRKLKEPLRLLSEAAEKIAGQDLDVSLSYEWKDEMGALCGAFDKMRAALRENNRAMWEMLEERRLLQASVAHDLRNPIAIIEGYVEYLESALAEGMPEPEKLGRIVKNLGRASGRLECYTESVRLLNQSEETVLLPKPVRAAALLAELSGELAVLAEGSSLRLTVTEMPPDREISVDEAALSRILENVVGNALRFAKTEIRLAFSLAERRLAVLVEDDGEGFPPEVLRQGRKVLWTEGGEHMGIGLAVSRLLCRKHGGDLELFNGERGACVKIRLTV